MDEIIKKLEEQNKKIEEMQATVNALYKYFKWTFIAGIVTFLIPLVIVIFVLPYYLSNLSSALSGL